MKNQTKSKIKPIHLGIGFTIFSIIIISVLYFSKPQDNNPTITQTSAGIDQFMKEVQSIQSDVASDMEDYNNLAPKTSTAYSKNEAVKELYSKTAEELKADLLRPIQLTDRSDFHQELNQLFQVQEHQDFFQRQIEYARLKLDLAVVGMGIIRVDEVLKGQNATVQEKDRSEFIKYIRDQVQSAVASNDANFKAIVFKGLESSSS